MRSMCNGRRAATVFAALAFVLAPTAGYAADEVPSGLATAVEPDDSTGQADDVDTSTDEPSGLVAASRTYCSHDGYTATGDPLQRCTKLDNGYLSISSGHSKSKSWGFGERNRDCKSTIGLLQQRGKDKVQTPIAKC